jgi:hypothetical protein
MLLMNLTKSIQSKPVDFIGAFYLENLNVCDDLIKFFNDNPKKQQQGASRVNTNGKSTLGVNKEIKDSLDIYLSPNDMAPAWQLYQYELNKVIKQYTEMFPMSVRSSPWGIREFTNLQYYKPGGGYFDWHSERLTGAGHVAARNLVFMTYLNDVTDGGETEFYHQEVKVKPEKGLTLIWPADWTYYHRGVTSPTQDKYIITGWLSFQS